MTDRALKWILNSLQGTSFSAGQRYVWCLDENALDALSLVPPLNADATLEVISNRWDVAEQARHHFPQTRFSDFDLNHHPDSTLDGFFYRVSKEKALVHHLLNQAWRCLKLGGRLYLSGLKNEGTKTYIEKIAALFDCEKNIEKDGEAYNAWLEKKVHFDIHHQLDTAEYTLIRPIENSVGLNLVSKPGVFGWNKIDVGSQLLIEQLEQALAHHQASMKCPPPRTGLDLGCGYGFLTIAAAHCQGTENIEQWILTDNNAAAIATASENLKVNKLPGTTVATDAGAEINANADLVLCNPPFHQGFAIDGDLTDKFLTNAHRLLAPDGLALFVVNQFIPLERKAAPHFQQVDTLINSRGFKVVRLARPATRPTR